MPQDPGSGLSLLLVAAREGVPVRALRIIARARIATTKAEEGKHRERAGTQAVVVEPVGQLDRLVRMTLRPPQAVDQAPVTGETLMQPGLERRLGSGLDKRLLQHGDRSLERDSLRQEHERLRPRSAGRRASDQLEGDCSRARAFSGCEVSARRRQGPPVPIILRVRRRCLDRELGELRCRDRSTVRDRRACRLLECLCESGVGSLRRERLVSCAGNGLVDPVHDLRVRMPPGRGRGLLVEHGGEQWVREPDCAVLELDHAVRVGRLEHSLSEPAGR